MKQVTNDLELVQYLSQTRGLPVDEVTRLLDEMLGFFDETCEQFVQRRHKELQQTGQSNPSIYGQIQKELKQRRFVAPGLSERQIRRIIYG